MQELIPLLQKYAPILLRIYKIMQSTTAGGGGESKLPLLIDTLEKYNNSQATGSILIDFSKGRIANIDTRVRITAMEDTSILK